MWFLEEREGSKDNPNFPVSITGSMGASNK